jgi:hypothetical protein
MNPTRAQIKNAEQHERFNAALAHFLVEINEIDAGVMADERWPDSPPDWWVAMSRLRDECLRTRAQT